jgi:hypothetical protein
MDVIAIVEFNDLGRPLRNKYFIPMNVLTKTEVGTLVSADHRMYSDELRQRKKMGLDATALFTLQCESSVLTANL